MRRATGAALAGLLGAALGSLAAGCHRAAPAAPAPDASAAPPPAASPLAVGPARCKPTPLAHRLGEPTDGDLEVGDATVTPAGIAVGLVHRTAAGRVAAVALLPADAASIQVVDLAPTLGDAPPPRVAPRGAGWLAAAYALPAREGGVDGARELAVYSITASGAVTQTGSVPQQRDDSFAFDLAPGLVAWDESAPPAATGPATGGKPAEPGAPRGVVRVAELSAEGRAGPARDASPADSDADSPRVVPLGVGYALLWIARRPDRAGPVDAAASVEVTGEARAFGWLEALALDAHGAAAGPVRRLTAGSGHVSAFDVTELAGAAGGKPEGIVVARDDGESVDGSGGALLRVRLREADQDPASAFQTDGLGRGAPAFVAGAPPWLAWVALREETRLLALDAAALPLGPPSAEPELDDGRPLALLRSAAGARLLAATPGDPATALRVLACAP